MAKQTTPRPSEKTVDLSRLNNKKEIKEDFSKLGINPKLNALLNLAKNISDEKIANRYGESTTEEEKKLFHDLATACLESTTSLESLKAMYQTAYAQKKHAELFAGILPSRTPSRFGRELNETYRQLKEKADNEVKEKSESIKETDGIQLDTAK